MSIFEEYRAFKVYLSYEPVISNDRNLSSENVFEHTENAQYSILRIHTLAGLISLQCPMFLYVDRETRIRFSLCSKAPFYGAAQLLNFRWIIFMSKNPVIGVICASENSHFFLFWSPISGVLRT